MSAPAGFLLLGFPRSGTTLLSRLLNAHPQISCPPETYAMAAAARFLHEQTRVEGPPIGVLSGLAFCGIPEEEIMASLRALVVSYQRQISGELPVWVEKTAINVFHLEMLEQLLQGHAKFIVLERHPLDVIVSNLGLSEVMGAQLDEIFALTQATNSPQEGLAQAWAGRARALDAFCARQGEEAVCRLTYEELTHAPEATLARIFAFIGHEADPEAVIQQAFAAPPAVGLGDFNIDMTTGIRPAAANKWRGKIGKGTLARILPILAPEMERLGYALPKAPKQPDRAQAVRQLQMATEMKRDMARRAAEDKT